MKGDWYIHDDFKLGILESAYKSIIECCDPACGRDGVAATPLRASKAMLYWTGGYRIDPLELLKIFNEEDTIPTVAEALVVVRDIPFASMCEHHLAPFHGVVSIGYTPSSGRVFGLSKLGRLVDALARRFQVQERLTAEIATTIGKALSPDFVGVHVKASHSCMSSRGIKAHGSDTVTTSYIGPNIAAHKSEFLSLLNGS